MALLFTVIFLSKTLISGRIAMVKCITPIPSICVAMFSGPISTSKMSSFEEEDSGNLFVELPDSWLCFESKFTSMDYMLELRHKWFAYFLFMLNKPGVPLEKVSFFSRF